MVADAVFLGIDIGTSGVRGSCVNTAGEEITRYQIELPLPELINGQIQQAPSTWKQAVDQVIQHLADTLAPMKISALAIDGTSSTVLLCDAEGQPCGPALMYNDQSSQQQAVRIAETAPAETAAHGASSSLAKIMQLLESYPAARHICHQADWVAASLSGHYDLSDENNCLKLGYDPVAQCWPNWLKALKLPDNCLPRVLPPGSEIGVILNQRAAELGLPRDCKIIAGTTDSIAAFIATGASHTGDAVTSLGSSIAIKIISQRPVFAADYGIYSHRLGQHWLAGGASNSGGSVLLQHFNLQQITQMSQIVKPDLPTGLDYYPLAGMGERFPLNDPDKIARLTPRPDSDVDFFQGMLEGMARIEAAGYRKLAELGAPQPVKIITAGGGSRNPAWSRIRERETGVTVVNAEHSEASYGAALLALRGCDH